MMTLGWGFDGERIAKDVKKKKEKKNKGGLCKIMAESYLAMLKHRQYENHTIRKRMIGGQKTD